MYIKQIKKQKVKDNMEVIGYIFGLGGMAFGLMAYQAVEKMKLEIIEIQKKLDELSK